MAATSLHNACGQDTGVMGKSVKQEGRIAGKWVRVSLGVTLGRNKNKYLDVWTDEKRFRVLTLVSTQVLHHKTKHQL